MSWFFFALAGAIGALLVGMIGFGSSLVILPVLLLVFPGMFEPEIAVRLAVGTTMASMIIGAISAGLAQSHNQTICRPLLRLMILPYLLGAGLGPWVSRYLPVEVLSYYIVALLLFVSFRTLRATDHTVTQRKWADFRGQILLVHFVIGLVSSVGGIASGIFAIPYLSRFNLSLRTVIATSTVAAALYSLFATLGHISAGLGVEARPEWSLGFVYLPAFAVMSAAGAICARIGVRLGARVSEVWLRRLLSVFLIVAAVIIVIR